MGIIAKQGLKNIYSTYLGFIIGGVYTALIVPKAFNDNLEYWGLARLLLSFTMIIAPWVQLGIPNIILKYYPIQSNKENSKMLSSLLFWLLIISIIIVLVIFLFPNLFYSRDKKLLIENIFYIIPLLLGFVAFEVSSALSKSMLNSTFPVFLKETVYRLYLLILVLLYWFKIVNFSIFIIAFSVSYIVILIPLLIYISNKAQILFNINYKYIFNKNTLKYFKYSFFIMLSGGAGIFMINIDSVMINSYLSLKDITIYTTWFYLATFLNIPSRSIASIATPIISKSLNDNEIELTKSIYIKSSVVPFALSSLLFLLILLNLDLFSLYLGDKFSNAKYVYVFIGIGNLANIISGVNGTIIILSKYYRYDILLQSLMIFVVVISNMLLIPIYGIIGASIATAIALVFINMIRIGFIYFVFKIHPFNKHTIILITTVSVFYFIIYLIQLNSNIYINLLFSAVLSLIYLVIIYKLNIYDNLNKLIKTLILDKIHH